MSAIKTMIERRINQLVNAALEKINLTDTEKQTLEIEIYGLLDCK